jgi:hypothetical protein
MHVLRVRQRDGREGLQALRQGIAGSAAPDELPLLRVTQPDHGNRLRLVLPEAAEFLA